MKRWRQTARLAAAAAAVMLALAAPVAASAPESLSVQGPSPGWTETISPERVPLETAPAESAESAETAPAESAESAETAPAESAESTESAETPGTPESGETAAPGPADVRPGAVVDAAGLLTGEQAASCAALMEEFQNQYQVGMALLTTDQPDEAALETALARVSFPEGGILVVAGPGPARICTTGEAARVLNQIWAEDLLAESGHLLAEGDYPAFLDDLAYQAGLMLQEERPMATLQQQPAYSDGDVPLDLTQKVYDFANLLTDSEEQALAARIREFCDAAALDLPLVTISDAEGKSSRDYADDFYDYNGFGVGEDADGLLLLIDMENRQVWLSTTGRAIALFTDSDIQSVTDPVASRLGEGDYFGGCQTGIQRIIDHVEEEMDRATLSGRLARSARRLPYYLLAAAACTVVTILVMASRHRTARAARHATAYLDRESLCFPLREDQFVRSSLTRHRIESSSGGGGGTSTHSGSSGQSHGGGGSSF